MNFPIAKFLKPQSKMMVMAVISVVVFFGLAYVVQLAFDVEGRVGIGGCRRRGMVMIVISVVVGVLENRRHPMQTHWCQSSLPRDGSWCQV
ncbi:hypothetical protein FF2_027118 [Malus domestica]